MLSESSTRALHPGQSVENIHSHRQKPLKSHLFIEKKPRRWLSSGGIHSCWMVIQACSSSRGSCLLRDLLKCFCSHETGLQEVNPCHHLCDSPCSFNWTNYSSHLLFRKINRCVELLAQNGCHVPAWPDGLQQWVIKLSLQAQQLRFAKKPKPYFIPLELNI